MVDNRHLKRVRMFEKLFAQGFEHLTTDSDIQEIVAVLPDLDTTIKEHASRYPLDKIAKVDLAILRLAVYELKNEHKNPPKVVIDEAVTLAREYGNEKSYAFVNGVLGSILKSM